MRERLIRVMGTDHEHTDKYQTSKCEPTMRIKKLLAAIEIWKPTDADLQAFEARIAAKEAEFAAEAKKRELPQGWLNKVYAAIKP